MTNTHNKAANLQRALGVVYIAIAVATFSHTTWSAAIVFQGQLPTDLEGRIWWYIQGALLAVAIDVGMILSARILSIEWSWPMLAAFVLAAIASAYTQVLYAAHHADAFTFGTGVTDVWVERLQELVDARVVILPLALPLFAIIYTLSAHPSIEESEPTITPVLVPTKAEVTFTVDSVDDDQAWSTDEGFFFRSEYTSRIYGPYDDSLKRDIQQRGHRTRETTKKANAAKVASNNGHSTDISVENMVESKYTEGQQP